MSEPKIAADPPYQPSQDSQHSQKDQLVQWVRLIRSYAREAGVEAKVRPILDHASPDSETIRIAWIGAANVGKSALLNSLVPGLGLPVSALPSHHAFAVTAEAQDESIATGKDLGPQHVQSNDPWLEQHKLAFFETSALDSSDEDLLGNIDRALLGVDCAVLIIDSLTPLRRAETTFLTACAGRGLPVLAVATKSDLLSSEDRATHEHYLRQQLTLCAPSAPLLEVCVSPSGEAGVEELKEAIGNLLRSTDLSAVRVHQAAVACLQALQGILPAALAAAEALALQQGKRTADLRTRELKSQELAGIWMQLELELESRRHGMDAELRSALRLRRQALVASLLHGLDGRTDIKAWWERDLTFSLTNEFQATADSFSVRINIRLGRDLDWLRQEVATRFRLPPAMRAVSPSVEIEPATPEERNLSLRSGNRVSLMSRAGQAAGVIIAGRLLFSAGLAGFTAGASILAGIAAEQMIRHLSTKDKARAAAELPIMVDRAFDEYMHTVSGRLKTGYTEIVEALKEQQRNWQVAQDAQLQAARLAGTPAGPVQQNLVDELQELQRAIETSLTA